MRRLGLTAMWLVGLVVAANGQTLIDVSGALATHDAVAGKGVSNGASVMQGARATIERHLSPSGSAWTGQNDGHAAAAAPAKTWASAKGSGGGSAAGRGWAKAADRAGDRAWAKAGDKAPAPATARR